MKREERNSEREHEKLVQSIHIVTCNINDHSLILKEAY